MLTMGRQSKAVARAAILATTVYTALAFLLSPPLGALGAAVGATAGIVTFKPLRENLDALYRRLQAAGVICAQRGGGIRFSPHFERNDA